MKNNVIVGILMAIGVVCSCTRFGPPAASTPPAPVPVVAEETPLKVAKGELKSRGQSLHDRLDFQVIEKDWGWIVTVGNLSGRQPKGWAYIPGDAVMMRIDKKGKVLGYKGVP